ncbi:MAG: class I SAM-dependent methyltransferase [Pseudomonadota bacterium]
MDQVKAQYEAFPYPERNPKDEKKRLITGSPSIPMEIDHYLYEGRRDWSKPMRVLFAGGGTGDGLIQFAQMMTQAKRPYEITYLDLSTAAHEIAEARAKIRGLDGIRFETGSLLDAASFGEFDYIDCCGVLHHLENPLDGFNALEAALAPEGGLGAMVYAPYGRAGVYALQESFNALFAGLPPDEKLKAAKQVYARLPDAHPFKANPHLVDHEQSDAGFYDLLLHSQDRAFDVGSLLDVMGQAGLRLLSFVPFGRYDLGRFVDAVSEDMSAAARMGLAEKLDGGIKTHVFYAARSAEPQRAVAASAAGQIPHLIGIGTEQLSLQIKKTGFVNLTVGGEKKKIDFQKSDASIVAGINGRRMVEEIAASSGLDGFLFQAGWARIEAALKPWGLLCYSSILRGR